MTMQVSATKRSFVRGIGEFLQRNGAVKFPNTDSLRGACDKVASEMVLTEPVVRNEQDQLYFQRPENGDVVKVAHQIVRVSNHLENQGYKMASDPSSISLATPEEGLNDIILEVKEAMLGNAVTSEDSSLQNKQKLSPQVETVQDEMLRPEGTYALTGVTTPKAKADAAANIGTEQPHPLAEMGVEGAATNTVVETSKHSSIEELIAKMATATGNAVTSEDSSLQNKQKNSPQVETIQDEMLRPEGDYALTGVNTPKAKADSAANVGTEETHPKKEMGVEGAASNTVVETAKHSAELSKIAADLMPHLPATMSPEDKIATVRNVAAIEPVLRRPYLEQVFAQYQ